MTNKERYLHIFREVPFFLLSREAQSVRVRSFQFPMVEATGSSLYDATEKLKEKIYYVDPMAKIFFNDGSL